MAGRFLKWTLIVGAVLVLTWCLPVMDLRVESARSWCDQLNRNIEAVKASTGAYPPTIDGLEPGPRPAPGLIFWRGVIYRVTTTGYTLLFQTGEENGHSWYCEYASDTEAWRSFGYLDPAT